VADSTTAPRIEQTGLLLDRNQWSSEEQWVCDNFHTPMDTIHEHAMLVSRGVRPMSLVQTWPGHDKQSVDRTAGVLHDVAAVWHTLSFALVTPEELAYYGFAAEQWVIELLWYALTSKNVEAHKHNIIGLLCGYSPKAIRKHEQLCTTAYVRRHV
jgi:hypothetical protein